MQEFTQLAQQAAAIIAEDPANEKIITECSQKATEAING